MNGKLNLILGPMFSGKTSELISRYERYILGNKKCLIIKYKDDKRYTTEDKIVTHNFNEKDAVSTDLLINIDSMVSSYDVILIDEIQFYNDSSFFCDKWANDGLIVEACGLNGDFNRKPFDQISLLIPLAESIRFLTAVDRVDGNDAPFTMRLNSLKDKVVIGGNESYSAVNRKNYQKGVNQQESLCTN